MTTENDETAAVTGHDGFKQVVQAGSPSSYHTFSICKVCLRQGVYTSADGRARRCRYCGTVVWVRGDLAHCGSCGKPLDQFDAAGKCVKCDADMCADCVLIHRDICAPCRQSFAQEAGDHDRTEVAS